MLNLPALLSTVLDEVDSGALLKRTDSDERAMIVDRGCASPSESYNSGFIAVHAPEEKSKKVDYACPLAYEIFFIPFESCDKWLVLTRGNGEPLEP